MRKLRDRRWTRASPARRGTLAIVAQAGAGALLCFECWAWQTNVTGTVAGHLDARAVAVDSVGHVFAAGYTVNTGTGQNFTVVKLSGHNGAELWRRVITAPPLVTGPDQAFAVAVDAAGDVVAGGTIGSTNLDRDFLVIKLAGADGTERWRQTINGSDNRDDMALAVAVDFTGNVVAGGLVTNTGTDADFTVLKFNGATGAELWRKTVNGSALFSPDAAFAVTTDAAGNVAAAGRTQNEGTGWDFTVVMFASGDGTEQWRKVINGSTDDRDEAFAIAVDNAGDVVAAGGIVNDTGFVDFTVIKFAGVGGVERWRQMIPGPAGDCEICPPSFPSEARAVRVNAAGDVVAAGVTELGLPIYKFSGVNGAELWTKLIGLTGSRALAMTAGGDVVSAGFSLDVSQDLNVIKFSGADGAVLWRRDIDGTQHSTDLGSAIAVNGAGDVVVAGMTRNTFEDFTVIKLRGADGGDSMSILRADFNADGKSDIFWRHTDGTNYIWNVNGASIIGGVLAIESQGLLPGVPGPDWAIVGIGDFNGDGKADILWRHTDGTNYVWHLDGSTINGGVLSIVSQGLLPGVPAGWSVAGIGDFNGDGKSDILWRHTDGTNYVWHIDGATINGGVLAISSQGLLPMVDATWSVAGVGDINGDGKADILWRKNDGTNYVWHVNGATINGGVLTIASQGLLPGVDATWSVVGVGDFNADGKLDVLWRHTNGTNYVWHVDGASISGGVLAIVSQGLLPTVADMGWSVVGVGDYNGDGKADIFWRHGIGTNYVWQVDGATINGGVLAIPSQGLLPAVADMGWQVQNPK